jgi:hypothetical protein
MGMFDNINLEELDADKIEKDIESGGIVPAGKYHSRLIGYAPKERDNGVAHELTFQIASGEFAGREIKHTIYPAKNHDGAQRVQNVVIRFSHVLGLLRKVTENGKSRYVEIVKGNTFVDCLGREAVIDVIVEEYDRLDKDTKKPTGQKGKINKLSMFGIEAVAGATATVTTANHSTPPSTTSGGGSQTVGVGVGNTAKANMFDDL